MTPRLMTGAQVATYCGVTPATFSKWAAAGIVPKPLPGTRRWDRRAIDAALDKASGFTPAAAQEDAFAQWEREYDAGKKNV